MYLTGTKSKFSSLMAINNPKMLLPPLALTSLLILVSAALLGAINGHDFEIKEATVEGIGRAFAEGKLSSSQLVESYLRRIEALNPLLRAVVEVNPDAVDQAAAADRERESRSPASPPLSPLHGVPVLLKDTIATKDKLNTTAGSYVLLGSVVPRDAGVVERLREAGAVILGKASLSEWYRFRSLENVPNGWCARSGQGVNPYVESGDPCGSSSGPAIAVAANLVLVSVGTETHCSIICPADHNSVVGLKPTVGLTSRAGVIPMLPLLDSVGPICRTVSDAVHVLDVIVGVDPRDEATMEASKFIPAGGYNQFLNPYGLRGKRLGVFRNPFSNGSTSTVISMFEHHLDALRQGGAVIVDNLEIANIHIILNPGQSGELTLMKAGFKLSINDYLKELITSPVRSLAEIIAFIENNPHLEKTKEIGQDMFIAAEKTNGFGEKERRAAKRIEQLSMDGFEKMMSENNLDAMVTLGSDSIAVMAIGGYPAITVPAGYDTNGMPFGICFGGLKGSEPRLIEIAYGFEKATMLGQTFHTGTAILPFGSVAITGQRPFSIKEATVHDLHIAFKHNQLTSRQLVEFYLDRIRKLNPLLRAVIEVNPDALHQADKADQERRANATGSLSGLHGIPVLLKDNIATKDKMNTTAGSYALLGSVVRRDAGVAARLRKAGAIILGKGSLSEWSAFRGLSIPNGWCARSGQGKNPYVLSSDTCGSSSGPAVSAAANMAAVTLGSETDGSILCPSSWNSVVGIKPTVGLTSRAGVIPITPKQDTVGPICRTVSDAVYVLDAIVGFDSRDAAATKPASKYIPRGGYRQFLKEDGLSGKRLGIVRNPFFNFDTEPEVGQAFEHHLQTLRQRGAIVVDNLTLARIDEVMDQQGSGELNSMLIEFKKAIDIYLKDLVTSPVRSLADLIAYNNKHEKLEMPNNHDQAIFLAAEAIKGNQTDMLEQKNLENLSVNGLEKLMKEKKLDALVTPRSDFSTVLAIGGYPGISVPAGYGRNGVPFGMCFGGLKGSEPKLIEIAYGFEQATRIRRLPSYRK